MMERKIYQGKKSSTLVVCNKGAHFASPPASQVDPGAKAKVKLLWTGNLLVAQGDVTETWTFTKKY